MDRSLASGGEIDTLRASPETHFRLLGPLKVIGPNGPLIIPSGRQQIVLGAFLVELERVVSIDQLIDLIWEYDPPNTARTQVQICVSLLRRLLAPTGAEIATHAPGYQLVVEPWRVDAHVQRNLANEAAALLKEGRREEAADRYRAAAALWTGPTLNGLGSGPLRARAAQLDEERISLIESRLEIELDLGRHRQVIGEIGALVEEYPLRERLRAQLMLALYRSGRQADALNAYRVGRELLVEELGLEPGEELRDLESAVLSADPALRAPETWREKTLTMAGHPSAGRSVPRQLPSDTSDFIGRKHVITDLRNALLEGEAANVAVLMGRPGVGKSATAVRVAHLLADEHYPDGQLYCDLRATRGTPVSATTALSRFLRALGVPAQAIPEDVDERAAIYRELLATRRMLVVLDDAALESQLLPLLPAGPGCGVVITSRYFLTGLPGATSIQVENLTDEASIALLSQVLGADRVSAEPEAARALVRAVGHLPLALRIVSARLAARPRWGLTAMVERLADERHRLDELAHGDMTVRASLSLSHEGIDPLAARAFRLLGALEGPTVPMWAAAALLDDSRPFPTDLVEPLVNAHMIDIIGVDSANEPVYRFHELVRDYAREQLARQDVVHRRDAVARVLGGWLSLLDSANQVMTGGDYLRLRGNAPRWNPPKQYVSRLLTDPYCWLEAERANIKHTVFQAVAEGMDEHAWDVVVGYSLFLGRKGYTEDMDELFAAVEPLLRERENRRGLAALIVSAQDASLAQRGSLERIARVNEALDVFADLGDTHGQALVQRQLADLVDKQEVRTRIHLCEQALQGFIKVGDLGGQRRCLILMGYLRFRDGDEKRGMAELGQGLSLAEKSGDPRALAQALRKMGVLEKERTEYDRASEHLERAYTLVDTLDDPVGKAIILRELGRVQGISGRTAQARSLLTRSAEIFGELRFTEKRNEVELDLVGLG
ncbi:SARP family transcriptional regulator [Nocardiopsis terrae]|uniref:DNA-binding SARP family transcriptional activator n=1 Tax=Nocardiopsis terrae TaxID=372655 RepID=A0ABR9HFH6_9ACTN|nr:BTAD domain-containing putative transcriptional regulator [Nocardiopsis terrae]MBE1457793.1 DNA-binding SARP family transcriptional activator [Nocardiopsis terrae]GHC84239.1 SARP family transcriptional regulator [Nocardiopsis terrae]